MHARLEPQFFLRPPVVVARALLGQRLVRRFHGQILAGLIVETEAYLGPVDRAAHSFNHRHTPRNHSMYLPGGHAYVYFTYGMHYCVNVVTQTAGQPTAVLLRALQPTDGLPLMRQHRGLKPQIPDTQLCSGPAKLCQALGIDRTLDGTDLIAGRELWLERARPRAYPWTSIVVGPRIGIAYAGPWADKPLRFHLRDNPHVSRP